jgi:hypothetical protein
MLVRTLKKKIAKLSQKILSLNHFLTVEFNLIFAKKTYSNIWK